MWELLDRIWAYWYPRALRGDDRAAEMCMKVLDTRHAMMGL